jgi:hypothetical protein
MDHTEQLLQALEASTKELRTLVERYGCEESTYLQIVANEVLTTVVREGVKQ